MAKQVKFYVVWKGRKPGIYLSWNDCKRQVDGFSGARFKSFPTRILAEAAFRDGAAASAVAASPGAKAPKRTAVQGDANSGEIDRDSVAVDAACSGNPGLLEYRGVDLKTGAEIFREGPFIEGTNNIGEFLAIVHALRMLGEAGDERLIYSDSEIAIGWVAAKRIRTTLTQGDSNRRLFERIDEAVNWLKSNTPANEIRKWRTERWGENPADFGRK